MYWVMRTYTFRLGEKVIMLLETTHSGNSPSKDRYVAYDMQDDNQDIHDFSSVRSGFNERNLAP